MFTVTESESSGPRSSQCLKHWPWTRRHLYRGEGWSREASWTLRKFMIKQKPNTLSSRIPAVDKVQCYSKLSKATITTTPMVIKQWSESEQKGQGVSCPSETVSSLGLFRNTLTFSSTFLSGAKCHFRQRVYFPPHEDNVHCALLPFLLRLPVCLVQWI